MIVSPAQIEAAVSEKSNVIFIDREKRLQHALDAMTKKLLAA